MLSVDSLVDGYSCCSPFLFFLPFSIVGFIYVITVPGGLWADSDHTFFQRSMFLEGRFKDATVTVSMKLGRMDSIYGISPY